ncbi:MAG: hypothetical protein ABRQ38_20475 [Candidatus Eremiobacterota bacterium]
MKYHITYILPAGREEYLYSQYDFLRNNYGGEFIHLNKKDEELHEEMRKLKKKNHINIAFWADLTHIDIHTMFNKLDIKQIFIEHGCSPKRWFTYSPNTEIRLKTLRDFAQLWPTNPMEEEEYKRGGRETEKKIKKVGYLKALEYYRESTVNKNQIYLCPSYWADWGEMELAVEILEHISPEYTCYVSLHPGAFSLYFDKLDRAFKENKNIILLKKTEEKIEKLKSSETVIGSNGTPLTEGLYMKKKVIFIKGKDLSWEKIKLLELSSHLFAPVLDDSVKMSHISELDMALKKTKYPGSAKNIFYRTNFSKEETIKVIDKAFSEFLKNRNV